MNLDWVISFSFFWAFITAHLAKTRGRNPWLWFTLGFFITILAPCFLYLLPKKRAKRKVAVRKVTRPALKIDEKYHTLFWYYLDCANAQYGPMSFDAFKRAYFEGKVSADTFVWNEAFDQWKRFKECVKVVREAQQP